MAVPRAVRGALYVLTCASIAAGAATPRKSNVLAATAAGSAILIGALSLQGPLDRQEVILAPNVLSLIDRTAQDRILGPGPGRSLALDAAPGLAAEAPKEGSGDTVREEARDFSFVNFDLPRDLMIDLVEGVRRNAFPAGQPLL
ncbi:MAG: hypothetical protein AAB425_02440, partial [Bdellovibrionota bacterium]